MLAPKEITELLTVAVKQMQALLPSLVQEADVNISAPLLDRYREFLEKLKHCKSHETYLEEDAGWDWIWDDQANYTYMQLYGRLAWINMQLLNML